VDPTETISPPTVAPSRGPHLAGLDGLRGLAILMVMVHHFVRPNVDVPGPLHMWVRAAAESCWMGVDLFFALSGFLITGILMDALASRNYFRNFYMRRILRVFPLYYTVLLVFILCAPLLHVVWDRQLPTLLTYTNRIFIDPHRPGFNFYFGGENNLTAFWSLAVEEQFYFVWPLLIFLFKRPARLIPLALLLSFASIATRIYLVHRNTASEVILASLACRADALLAGALLALLIRHGYRKLTLKFAGPIAGIGALYLIAFFVTRHGIERENPFILQFGFSIIAIFCTSLVALTLDPLRIVSRLFAVSWLRFFGKYSYGLYVLHTVLPAFYLAALVGWAAHWPVSQTMQHLLVAVLEFAIALGAAVLSFHFYETPFLRLKKHFPSFAPRPRRTPPPADRLPSLAATTAPPLAEAEKH